MNKDNVKKGADFKFVHNEDIQKIAEVMMQDCVGDYATPDTVPEWTWVQNNASYVHTRNGIDGVFEFILNLANDFPDIPENLEKLIEEAKSQGLAYLLIHQGT